MDRFGHRLAVLQIRCGLDRQGLVIARKALGRQSTHRQRLAFANHLSRLKSGVRGQRADGVSLAVLTQLATGFDYPTLSSFIAALEDIRLR